MTAPLSRVAICILGILAATGCATPRYAFSSAAPHATDRLNEPPYTIEDARQLPMFTGHEGLPIDWADLLQAGDWAQVIIIGEQHDDAVGHAVQLAMVQDILAAAPAVSQPSSRRRTPFALSLEMLERDEQAITDDYLDGIVTVEDFAKQTFSESWAGKGSWAEWYQPIIDAVKERYGAVIAANAPRQYVRMARTQGFDRMRALPRERRALFDLPRRADDAHYQRRFFDLMKDSSAHGESGTATQEDTFTAQRRMDAAFRSQSLWDATMAGSIVQARNAGSRKIVHLVGQFHSDFQGGIVQQLRSRWPRVRILTISMQREDSDQLREEDRHRADIIIYTGARPPEPEEDTKPDDAPDDAENVIEENPDEPQPLPAETEPTR